MVAAQAGRAASAAPLDGNRRRRVANRNRQDGPTRQQERPGRRTHRNGTGSPVAAALRVPHERRRPGATPRTLGIQPPPQPSPTPAGEGDRGMGVGGQLLGPPEALRAARGRGVPPRPPRRRRPLLLGRLPQHRHPGALAGGEEAAPPEHLLPHPLPLRKGPFRLVWFPPIPPLPSLVTRSPLVVYGSFSSPRRLISPGV